jgi:signal transduction histidine kinase
LPSYGAGVTRLRSIIARMPVRVRVAVAFTSVMALLLAAMGLLLYSLLRSELDAGVDRGLRSRATDVAALVQQAELPGAGARASPLTDHGDFAQIVDATGAVIDAPPPLRQRPILTSGELGAAARATILIDHPHLPLPLPQTGRERLLAMPVSAHGRQLIVVVGASLATRDDAMRRLARLLLLGFPVTLLLAAAAGYGAAAGALRPVELMRRRAREIQASESGRRLPVPASPDEVGRLGETLNEMLERLEVALARERTFVSDASHELRTPLAILKGELEVALVDAHDVKAFRVAVSSAAEETDRLIELAEDLLVVARLDHGPEAVRRENVEMLGVLEAVRRRFVRRAQEQGATVDVDAPAGLVAAIDSPRVEQALGNLVDNALRHGGGRIELTASCIGARLELHVRDDGPGFDERFIARAFERFSRADAARGRGGAGLGLAIVSAIASAHGGRARTANRPDGGADVWLELPVHG